MQKYENNGQLRNLTAIILKGILKKCYLCAYFIPLKMKFTFYKYQGTGNDFVIIDDREKTFPIDKKLIYNICHRRFGIGADGFMLLQNDANSDFLMNYFNSDGNESTMCGNGGRCLVQFAHDIKAIGTSTTFNAVDGLHEAQISPEVVSLKMIDVTDVETAENHSFLNTGSPHHIEFVEDIDAVDVFNQGRKIRYGSPYFEEGANVNFVQKIDEETLWVRTYERGVEDETYSCGTGVTAAAIASYQKGLMQKLPIKIKTLGGNLAVNFEKTANGFTNVHLIGPATFVCKGELDTENFEF